MPPGRRSVMNVIALVFSFSWLLSTELDNHSINRYVTTLPTEFLKAEKRFFLCRFDFDFELVFEGKINQNSSDTCIFRNYYSEPIYNSVLSFFNAKMIFLKYYDSCILFEVDSFSMHFRILDTDISSQSPNTHYYKEDYVNLYILCNLYCAINHSKIWICYFDAKIISHISYYHAKFVLVLSYRAGNFLDRTIHTFLLLEF